MYQVERKDGKVRITAGGSVIFNEAEGSLVLYRSRADGEFQVSKIGDLTDSQLLIALATAVTLPSKTGA